MRSILNEFREFAMRGNVIDMAVGIIIGGAFGKITSSVVADILTPPIGLLIGGVDFSDLAITLKVATADSAAVTIGYGKFIQTSIDFIIIAFAVFLLIKFINTLKREAVAEPEAPPAPPEPTAEERLLSEIRDLLKARC